ncbi:hypothetical protein [Allokutzneria oryzae]|uniref:DUF3618 domain-containing protein n=1 Tax=Allokutzneria oryzae TaxID=1378989 RepID=A0ABV5ZTX7_9PSEU
MSTPQHAAQSKHENKTEEVRKKAHEEAESLREKATEVKDKVSEQVDTGLSKLPPEVSGKVKKIMAEARRHPLQAALMGLGALSILRRLVQRKK